MELETKFSHERFILRAVELAQKNIEGQDGGPFGCVIVKNGQIVAEGVNSVTRDNDPTAHAEVVALRKACQALGHFELRDCEVYTSCEPCPMCLGALYWARPKAIYYSATKENAANAGFDDQFIYEEIAKPINQRQVKFQQILPNATSKLFKSWQSKTNKIDY